MAIKFTEREMIGIRRKLKDYARRTVVHTSMQKITIGDLAKAAGISQSAFYKFYTLCGLAKSTGRTEKAV